MACRNVVYHTIFSLWALSGMALTDHRVASKSSDETCLASRKLLRLLHGIGRILPATDDG